VLLQLSDLHFGPHSRFDGCDLARLAAQCRQALDEARGDLGWREPIGLVVVTGDVAETARPPEYVAAATFFLALAEQLALPPHRFVFVPGNHDISWTKCRMVEDQLKDGEFPEVELRTRLDTVKFTHFDKFIRDVHGGRPRHEVHGASVTSLPYGVFIHDFADLGLSVAALNSCERESHRKEDHVGSMSAAQAQAVLDHWRGSRSEVIRIAAVHHNPAALASAAIDQWLAFLRSRAVDLTIDVVERIASNFVGFEGHEYLRNLAADANASLILHGHHHASEAHQAWAWRGRAPSGTGDTRIVSAGSWGLAPESGKLPRDQPVVMQLIRLDPADAQLRAVLLSYDPTARLTGEVHPGRFILDAQTRSDRPIGLSLPPSVRGRFRSVAASSDVPEVAATRRSASHVSNLAAVIAHYNARKKGSFAAWELRTAGPHPTLDNRPIEITLDEMYIPLRFGAESDPAKLDRGVPITASDLLHHRRPLVVVGPAGSGKTTWMRWTFRRLVEDPRTVPFFLELRSIGAAWKTPQDAVRPIDSYLIDELSACSIEDAASVVTALLAESSGLRTVILIDGWDELGAQGERMRERLVEFCSAFPQAVVVVSSRPYGDTRPAGAQSFKTLHIQPLSDDDVRLLATSFHRRVHGLDDQAGARATDEFMAALAASPDARSLASTALLLTMMLLLSREGPLPDRRHKLYTACLRNMLFHRVTQRAVDRGQWRPEDSEERLRVVAELAYRMQTEGYMSLHAVDQREQERAQWRPEEGDERLRVGYGMQTEEYKKSRRAPIIREWDAAVGLLLAGRADRADPTDWTRDRCARFLRWLVAAAGVLIDRSDGSVHFAHLSFQEHLAAYHLYCTREGDERVAVVHAHMNDRNWWETLRLWAGLTGDKGHDKLSPVLARLREDPAGYWLAGMIFADGAGQRSDFEAWTVDLAVRLSEPHGSGDEDDCAQAWGACKQSDRRGALAKYLTSAGASLRWLEATWLADWCRLALLEVAPAHALLAFKTPSGHAVAVGRSRALLGSTAIWPDGGELAVLRLWPSARARIGVRLQTAISVGAQLPDLIAMLPSLLEREARSWSAEDDILARDFAQSFLRHFGWNFVQDSNIYFIRDFARYFVYYLARNFGRNFIADFVPNFGHYFVKGLLRDSDLYLDQNSVQELGSYFRRDFRRHFARYFTRYFVRDFGLDLGVVNPLSAQWLPSLAFVELGSTYGRATARAAFAYGARTKSPGRPLLTLFGASCRSSFAPFDTGHITELTRVCNAFDGDPLWPALARHVARISTHQDHKLLEHLARDSEERLPPLSWGLQYYVRGDLVFDDDLVLSLDELCTRANLPPLPLLEPMPDEIEIRWPPTR
jgi:3',5'-cyclic AMP phosphodiesterase CpdA